MSVSVDVLVVLEALGALNRRHYAAVFNHREVLRWRVDCSLE